MATIRQRIAFKKVVKGSTLTQAMKDVNYAPSTAARTNKLTRTKGWKELLEKTLSDDLLLKVHRDGLKAYKVEKGAVIGGEVGIESAEIHVPDFATRHKYLDTAYKIRGRLEENGEKGDTYNTIVLNGEQGSRFAQHYLARLARSEKRPDLISDSNEPEV